MQRMLAVLSVIASLPGCKAQAVAVDAGPAAVASRETGLAKAPPPLRAPRPTVPPLPDLPGLTAHEAAATPPPTTPQTGSTCRGVWNGSDFAPLSCFSASIVSGVTEDGAVPLVAENVLDNEVASQPVVVDHRLEGTEGPVRNQSTTPACTAFAMAAAMDHALSRWSGKPSHVSVMEIWSRYHLPEEQTSIQSNLNQELGPEEDWPFSVTEANGWLPCPASGKPPKSGCGLGVDGTHVKKVAAEPVAAFDEVEKLVTVDTRTLRSKIAGGQDVLVAMSVPDSFAPKGKPGARYIPHYTKTAGDDTGHAMLLSGYATLKGETYFLIHNSWGTAWGDGGYAWIHEATVTKWTREAVTLDAEPKAAPALRPKRQRGETTCDGALVPDSIRGTCAPLCPDGSPRHDQVCAVAGQCPASYVNLTGSCVLAAPKTTGSDPKTGIAWSCGPGGCVYTLPRAVDPQCTGNSCKASCPAPDFRVAKEKGAITCVE